MMFAHEELSVSRSGKPFDADAIRLIAADGPPLKQVTRK